MLGRVRERAKERREREVAQGGGGWEVARERARRLEDGLLVGRLGLGLVFFLFFKF